MTLCTRIEVRLLNDGFTQPVKCCFSAASVNLDLVREVRNVWQFYRDRRPETYGALTQL